MLNYPPNTYPPNSYPPNAYPPNAHPQQNMYQQQNTYQQNTITTNTITTNNHVAKQMENCCCCFPLNVGVTFICIFELILAMGFFYMIFEEDGGTFYQFNAVLCIGLFILGVIATAGQKKSRMNQFRILYTLKTIWFSMCAFYFIAGAVGGASSNAVLDDGEKFTGGLAVAVAMTVSAIMLLTCYFNMVIMRFYDYLYKH